MNKKIYMQIIVFTLIIMVLTETGAVSLSGINLVINEELVTGETVLTIFDGDMDITGNCSFRDNRIFIPSSLYAGRQTIALKLRIPVLDY